MSGSRRSCRVKAFQKFCGPGLVSARCPSIALREYPEIDIVVAGKTPDQGDLFIVSLERTFRASSAIY
jgi:hypothetical protein